MIGKTITAVIDGYTGHELIFSDGSSVQFSSDDHLYIGEHAPVDTRRRAAIRQGRAEQARLLRLQREEESALGCDEWLERQKLKARQQVRAMSLQEANALLKGSFIGEIQRELNQVSLMRFEDINRQHYHQPISRCPNCGRTKCPELL